MKKEIIKDFDAIVIGSGHAGCEAAHILAKKGVKTLLLTLNLDSIAFLACNPSVGGTAKGHLVCEIDALGGVMGKIADSAAIQRRMLNASKGPAVQSLRAQEDKVMYHTNMKKLLEKTPNLKIKQGEASDILVKNGKIVGVKTAQGDTFACKSVVVATGVYLNSDIIIGNYIKNCGPNGFANSSKLTNSLIKLGFNVRRFKTGTPVRIDSKTIDYSKLEIQKGDENIQSFSFDNRNKKIKNVADCYLTYTNAETHKIILDNLKLAPMYSGKIKGLGPRYCPSIETKVVRFADKERHQLFIEPEALSTDEIYLQGFSTSMPTFIQEKMVKSLKGFENAFIMRDAYAIEYDCIDSLDLYPTLESKNIKGLFFAGQINGTSGYEEAGAQGLLAGINSAQYVLGEEMLVLTRDNSYIGVLVDDLTTKGTNEPYRMMTSRAEYRLYLRQDNADIRLTEIGRKYGVIDNNRWNKYKKRLLNIQRIYEILGRRYNKNSFLFKLFEEKGETFIEGGLTLIDALKRANIQIDDLVKNVDELQKYNILDLKHVETEIKYKGYLQRQEVQINQMRKQEETVLPDDIDYFKIKGLRIEAQQKLDKIKPLNLGQASRISGVNPADIAVLTVFLKQYRKTNALNSEK